MTMLRWKIAQSAELRWWKGYLGKKDKTSYLAWKKNYWREFLQNLAEHLQLREGMHLLDAGCGPAGIFTILEPYRVTALDPLLEKYEETLPHFSRSDYPWVEFLAESMESCKLEDCFDGIFCLNAINHVHSLEQSLKNLARAARDGAPCVFSVDTHRHAALKPLFQWIPGDILHPHQYDLRDYGRFLEESGFSVQHTIRYKKGAIFDYHVVITRRQVRSKSSGK